MCREASSQAKRRRMLHFEDEVLDVDVLPLCDEDFSSTFLKSKVRIILPFFLFICAKFSSESYVLNHTVTHVLFLLLGEGRLVGWGVF